MLKPIGHRSIPGPDDVVVEQDTPREEIDRLLKEGKTVWIRTGSSLLKVEVLNGT